MGTEHAHLDPAEVMFDAFHRHANPRAHYVETHQPLPNTEAATHDGEPLPKWSEQSDEVKAQWGSVADAGREVFRIHETKTRPDAAPQSTSDQTSA